MQDKTVVITGGNRGIGKEIAISLAGSGALVVIVSRNSQRGVEALNDIRHASRNKNIELVVGDLGSIASTKNLANEILKRFPRISILINNAGVWMPQKEINPDGLEMSFMVNHLAPFILTNLLYEQLRQNAPARIVNISAALYIKGKVDLARTPYGDDYSRILSYPNTKLCNLLLMGEFAERIEGSGVTINSVHPGVIRTDLGSMNGIMGILLSMIKRFWGKPENGAIPAVRLASDPDLEGVNGKYFDLTNELDLSENAKDENLARGLWELSSKLSNLPVTV